MKRGESDFIIGDIFPKTGIDTNVIVDLILYKKAKDYFKEKEYNFPNKFLCTLHAVIGEAKGILINKFQYSKEKADLEIDKLLDELNIEKLPFKKVETDIEIIEKIGNKFMLNKEDVHIIYEFWKLNVKSIIVRDYAFEKTCKELQIKIITWPMFQ